MTSIRTHRPHRGFTLTELLMVIGIITFLVAIMGTVLGKLRERTRVSQVRTLIEKVNSGIDQYHLIFRAYPPATAPGGLTGDQALYYYLMTTFNPIPNAANGEKWADMYCAQCLSVQPTEVMTTAGKGDFMDAWKQPLIYTTTTQTDSSGVITVIPKVYSKGPNKIDDGGVTGTDDVVAGQ